MITPPTAAVIFHEGAGRGGAARMADAVAARLQTDGWTVERPIRTEYAGHAERDLAPALGPRVDRMVVVGGDGTLREVCSGLGEHAVDTDVALVPTGNANVVARELGVPLSPRAAVDVCASPDTRTIDVGIVRGIASDASDRVFLAMVEIGYGARVVRTVAGIRGGSFGFLYRLWGDAVYAAAGVFDLFRGGDPQVQVIVDDLDSGNVAAGVVVANTATYAKGWTMTPAASIDSGRLEWATRTRTDPGTVLRQVQAARNRRAAPSGNVTYGHGERIVLACGQPFEVQVDGDPAGASRRVEIGLVPGRIRMVVPEAG